MIKTPLILTGLAVLVLFLGVIVYDDISTIGFREATGLVVSVDSFPVYLEAHPLFKDLPKGSNVEIDLGNSKFAVSDKSVTTKSTVSEPDITVKLPDRYASRFGEVGLCVALGEAVANGEIEVSTELSKFELFLKYRKLLKYRKCFS